MFINFSHSSCGERQRQQEPEDAPDIHAQRNRRLLTDTCFFYHQILQQRARLDSLLLGFAKDGSSIVDIGPGGKHRPFPEQALESKDLQVILVDRDPQVTDAPLPSRTHAIRLDLLTVPDTLCDLSLLTIHLNNETILRTMGNVRGQCLEVLELLQRPVSLVINSHVLSYLPPHQSSKLMSLFLTNVAPEGRVVLADETNILARSPSDIPQYGSGIDAAMSAAAQRSDIVLEDDFLIAPVIPKRDRHTIAKGLESEWRATINRLGNAIHKGEDRSAIAILRPGSQYDGSGTMWSPTNRSKYVAIPGLGERVVVFRKKP